MCESDSLTTVVRTFSEPPGDAHFPLEPIGKAPYRLRVMPDYSFSLEPFSPEVLAAYRSFSTVLDQTDEKVAWKLKSCPFGPGSAMVVRDENGLIVGMNAYQSVDIRSSAGTVLSGHQSMDTVVHEVARGQGLFTRMYRAYYDQTDAGFVYGFPNKNSAPAFFGKLGWTRFGAVPMR